MTFSLSFSFAASVKMGKLQVEFVIDIQISDALKRFVISLFHHITYISNHIWHMLVFSVSVV